MILVTHAFSRRNAGDSLLVDLTLARIAAAGVPPSECLILALDAESFADLPHVEQVPGEPWRRMSARLIPAVAQLGASRAYMASRGRFRIGRLARLASSATAIVSVGGGFLRAGSRVERGGTLLNHLPQLMLAAASDRPTIYLPQSVGPLRGSIGKAVGRLLGRVDRMHVRDDSSLQDLRPYTSAVRVPDLAILHLADRWSGVPERAPNGGEVLLVARNLGDSRYERRLQQLAHSLREGVWAVQSDAPSTKSDRHFYKRLGIQAAGSLSGMLHDGRGDLVISVRLHGALQALLAGRPAIHLTYQRKGWAAYTDLGLEGFVHDARDFDFQLVADQARTLQTDASDFWARVATKISALREASTNLTADLRQRLKKSS